MLNNFFKGLGDVGRGAGYLRKNKSLIKILVPPTLINLVLLGVFVWLISAFYSTVFDGIAGLLGGLGFNGSAWWELILAGIFWVVRGILHAFLGLIFFTGVVIVMLLISQIINSPFYDLLSEAVEKRVTGVGLDQPFSLKRISKEACKTIVIEIKKVTFFVIVSLLLLLLHFIPVIGSILYAILANLFAAWDFGFNFVAYAMGRKLIPFGNQLALAKAHRARMIGFGAPLMIPFLNILLAPIFVVGGTLMYLEISQQKSGR